jgi:hypothetical protein
MVVVGADDEPESADGGPLPAVHAATTNMHTLMTGHRTRRTSVASRADLTDVGVVAQPQQTTSAGAPVDERRSAVSVRHAAAVRTASR